MLFPFFIGYSIVDYALKCKKMANDLNEQLKKCKDPKRKAELVANRNFWLQRCLDIQSLPKFLLKSISRLTEDYLAGKREEFPTRLERADWWARKRKRDHKIHLGIAIIIWLYILSR